MAVTFLAAVNSTLKRVRVLQGDDGDLVTSTVTSTATGLIATGAFTNSAHQNEIDIMIQVWNEAIDEVFSFGNIARGVASATLVLVASQREYTLPSDFDRFVGDTEAMMFRSATAQRVIEPYPGGYEQMLVDQAGLASQWLGEPNYFAISPVNLQTIRIDTNPTNDEAGWTYNALYQPVVSRTSTMATETMPFGDQVVLRLIPAVADHWQRIFKKEGDLVEFRKDIARSVGHAVQMMPRTRWGPGVG